MYVYKDLLTLCTLFSLTFFFFDFHFFNSIAFFSWHSNLLLLKLLSLFSKGILKKGIAKKKVLNGSKQQQREEFFFPLEFQKLFNNTTHQSFSSILFFWLMPSCRRLNISKNAVVRILSEIWRLNFSKILQKMEISVHLKIASQSELSKNNLNIFSSNEPSKLHKNNMLRRSDGV